MTQRDLKTRNGLQVYGRVYFGEAFVEGRYLRIDDKFYPGNWSESKSIEKIRIVCLVEWIIDVHIEEGFQFQPTDREIVPARLQTVAHSDTPDRPAIDGVD